MSPTKVETPKPKTPGKKGKSPKFTPPVTRRRSMKPQTPKQRTPKPAQKAVSPKIEEVKEPTPKIEKAATPKKSKPETPKVGKQKVETPKSEKPETPKSEKPKTPKSEKPETPKSAKKQKLNSGDAKQTGADDTSRKARKTAKTSEQRVEEDKRTLFVKGLAKGTERKDVENISKAVVDVRIFRSNKQGSGFAFIVFKTEADADKHFKTLKKIGQHSVTVDYVGQKSKNRIAKQKSAKKVVDPNMLYITGPALIDIDVVRSKFPKAYKIDLPTERRDKLQLKGFGFVHFKVAADAEAALKSCKNMVINGKKLLVKQATVRPDHPRYQKKLAKEKLDAARTANGQEASDENDEQVDDVDEGSDEVDEEDLEESGDDDDDDDDDDEEEDDDDE